MYKEIRNNLKESPAEEYIYEVGHDEGLYGPLKYIIADYNDYCTSRGSWSLINYYEMPKSVKSVLAKYRKMDDAPENVNEQCLVLQDGIYFGADADAKFKELQADKNKEIKKFTRKEAKAWNYWDPYN